MSQTKQKDRFDPLYQLFEYHLLNRSYDDSAVFIREVAEEYLLYLDSTPAHTPFHARSDLLKDLEAEAHELLIKKMYGCLSKSDYKNYGDVIEFADDTNEILRLDITPQKLSEKNQDKG